MSSDSQTHTFERRSSVDAFPRGIWGSPVANGSNTYSSSYPLGLSHTESKTFRSGSLAWGSASATTERRVSHALTEPAGQSGIWEGPRRKSTGAASSAPNNPPLLASLMPMGQPQPLNFTAPSISLLDQFAGIGEATRTAELARTGTGGAKQSNIAGHQSPHTSPLLAKSRLSMSSSPPLMSPSGARSPAAIPATLTPLSTPTQRVPLQSSTVPSAPSSPPRKPGARRKEWRRKRGEPPIIESLRNKKYHITIESILGNVADVSTDQYGSRFIQEHLASASEEVRHRFFEETLESLLPLMTDVFGNYVVQQLFELGLPEQRSQMVERMYGNVLNLSLQMYGCRVVQMALRYSKEPEKLYLAGELREHVAKCVRDHNGNHVVQKAVEYISPEHVQFIYSEIISNGFDFAKHTYGCRVVQRILEYGDKQSRELLLEQLRDHFADLVVDQYGNYVVQHIVENGSDDDRKRVLSSILPNIVPLSLHKYASNVVEKCFLRGNARQRSEIVQEILTAPSQGSNTPAVVTMIRDQYANYVIQKILDAAQADDYARLAAAIRPHIPGLKRSSYGKHLACIERLLA